MMRLIVKSYSLAMTQMNYISIGLKSYKELNTKEVIHEQITFLAPFLKLFIQVFCVRVKKKNNGLVFIHDISPFDT